MSYFNTIIEPSAGNGSFSNNIKNIHAFDIAPENKNIKKADFFDLDLSSFKKPMLIIGNPPFGRNNSLALKFIKKSCYFADVIAFVLPKSFKKQSLYEKIPLSFWKVYEEDLPENSFYYNNEEVNIPCVFQIYEKRNVERTKEKIKETDLFYFTKKENANLSFRRVGVYSGLCSKDINKSEQSHYFINAKDPEYVMNLINSIDWLYDNTVGPRSISKKELLKEIKKIEE